MTQRQRKLKRRRRHTGRSTVLLGVAVLWAFVYAVKLLTLGDAYSIFMSAPLLITALSVPMLRRVAAKTVCRSGSAAINRS